MKTLLISLIISLLPVSLETRETGILVTYKDGTGYYLEVSK